jgi:hypothetical protein
VKWYVRGCTVCHGDLHDDVETPGHARCLMCGRTYPIPGLPVTPTLTPTLEVLAGADDSSDIRLSQPTRLARTA